MGNYINNETRQNLQRDSRELFEHEPHELFVSINGLVQSSQKIEKNLNEQSVKIEFTETLEFVEVFSEQEVCLAFVSLEGFPLKNEENRNVLVNLSDERTLQLILRRTDLEVDLQVVYLDPNFEETEILFAKELELNSFEKFLQNETVKNDETPVFGEFLGNSYRPTFFQKLKDRFFPGGFGLNTATATAFMAFFVIAALLIGRFLIFVPSVSAVELLQEIRNQEEISETANGSVLYRTLNLEERKTSGEIIVKRKIEIRADASRKLTVRRLYNENNQLIAGEWRRNDGVSTFYVPNKMPELRPVPTDKDLINSPEDIWQMSVSAKGFESLMETPEKAEVEERDGKYLINYHSDKNQGIIKAVLVVNSEKRTSEQFLTVRSHNEEREFRFTETFFEKKASESVEKSAFEPDKDLLPKSLIKNANSLEINKTEQEKLTGDSTQTIENADKNPSSAGLTQELEVKVLQLLNNVNALSGDQINIVKTPDGKLRINGIVDARNRKEEILNALAEIRGNPAISVNILTPEEASKNKSVNRDAETIENVTVESRSAIPAGETLRNYFSKSGSADEKIEQEIRRYASGVLSKSSQMRRAALQMKQIAERFSTAELEKMDEPTRANWRKLVRQNAGNLLNQSEGLRNELNPIFNVNGGAGGGSVNTASDADLIRAVKRLFDLSVAVDKDVRSSFSISGGNSNNVPVKSGKFDSSLGEIINLSRQFK